MGILNIDLNIDNNFDADDPNTITCVKLLSCHIKLKNAKHLKKHISEALMSVAWHPERWQDFWMLEDEKKETEPIFTE